MLEIKNVTKIYKSKGGAETKALDDVSISFGETGLIFLLGKSGSGKSTLLNVSGGLDEPTSGEIVVKGKSSKDFTPSDFDSYRNTFVGFVFQEYNVLDEFNVEDNIALALELQGKPKDREKIHGLLREVELEDFAKRKPNTLSGGQKQRIAIARALIKDPQIIMADEPTGALDSATGKQVLDTLKKLSETRLVIVVSHDREFAETYGDRIVELKDGRIISDVSKTVISPRAIDENVTVIGKDTLSIKRGSKLSAESVKAIEDFVSGSDGDVIITRGEKQITAFKRANRMSDSGHTETFGVTDPASLDVREYQDSERAFIRSRLPATKALKIGASGLRLKPFRLVLTILLSVVAFVMFGLFSTLMVYDGDRVAKSSYMNSDYDFINLAKYYTVRVKDPDEPWTERNSTHFTDEDIKELADKYGNSTFGYFSLGDRYNNYDIDNAKVKDDDGYYRTEIGKFAYIPENNALRGKISGAYPQSINEICVSSYIAESLASKDCDLYKIAYTDRNEIYYSDKESVNTKSDVIGKYIVLSFNGKRTALKITGIFECEKVADKYDKLKDEEDNELKWYYGDYLNDGMFLMAFMSREFADNVDKYLPVRITQSKRYFTNFNNLVQYEYAGTYESKYTDILGNHAKNYEGEEADGIKSFFLGGKNKTALGEREAIVPAIEMARIMRQEIIDYYTELTLNGGFESEFELPEKKGESDLRYDEGDTDKQHGYYVIFDDWMIMEWDKYYDYESYCTAYDEYCQSRANTFAIEKYDNLFWTAVTTYESGRYTIDVDNGDGSYNKDFVDATKEERLAALDYIVSVTNNLQPKQFELIIDSYTRVNFTLVGFHEEDIYNNSDTKDGIFFSQSFIDEYLDMNTGTTVDRETNYVYEENAIYKGVFVEYDRSERVTDALLSSVGEKNKKANDVYYEIENSLSAAISGVNDYAATLSTVFLWVGVVFAVFAALLLFNFISMSISNKRKEIGILRAVGARGTDVFKIFFAESGIITGICTILAVIGTIILCAVINGLLKTELGLNVTLFVFGIASLAMMIGIALLVAFVSTFLPVYFAARKKPVDSIRAL